MKSHFTSEFFKGNRAKLRKLFTGTAPIVITANGLLQRGGDAPFAFHQDSNFWYLTGIDEPNIILVMDKDKEYLILPFRDEIVEMFDGRLVPEALTERSGISEIIDEKNGWKQLGSRLKRVKHIAIIAAPPPYIERHGFYTNPARSHLIERLKTINPEAELLDLRQQFMRMRSIKQVPELEAIQEAIKITLASLRKVTRKLERYGNENEIEAALSYEFHKAGAGGHAFDPIIASGAHTHQLHYQANNDLVTKGPLLMDVGAEVEHYAADITRTYPIGKFTKRQQAVYAAVEEVQHFAYGLLKPGVIPRDYESQVSDFMGEKLRELGLIKTIDTKSVRAYFPSMTSHFLGLDVHDIGDYIGPLEAGMVLTVEPGIYIPEENFGVRIEDDVLITPKGIAVLSKQLAQEL
jgi:Xaa-Pro aminopeptidase